MTSQGEAKSLLDSILGYGGNAHGMTAPEDRGPKIGTVDPAFDGTTAGARITFDGESTMSVRSYPWLDAAPRPGSRVVLLPVGRSFVIAGALDATATLTAPVRAVFVGNSNATNARPNATDNWPTALCAARNWTQHNYAQDFRSFMSSPVNYLTLAQDAVAGMTLEQRLQVEWAFVADGSSDARDDRTYADVLARAGQVYSTLRAGFPNARLVVLPMVWPADSQRYTGGSYTGATPGRVPMIALAMKEALQPYPGSIFIDNSWTWLTQRTDLMIATNDVHPNAQGHRRIAALVERAIRGESIRDFGQWTPPASLTTDFGTSNGSGTPINRTRGLAARREGWDVELLGGIWTGVAKSGSSITVATLADGLKPPYTVPKMGIMTGSNALVPVEIWPDGTIRVYGNFAANQGVVLDLVYRLG